MPVAEKLKKNKSLSKKINTYKAQVSVTLKKSVFDPQGKTVLDALHSLGFKEAQALRVGKFFDLRLFAKNQREAEVKVKTMCEKLLINPVIEEYQFQIEEIKS